MLILLTSFGAAGVPCKGVYAWQMAPRPPKWDQFPRRQILAAMSINLIDMARFEAAMLTARARSLRISPELKRVRHASVNIGSSTAGMPEWINIDGYPSSGVDIVADVRHRIPLANGCARRIFTEHLVEHLDYDHDVPGFFLECLRLLEPGGVLRVVVPDGEMYVRAYAEGTWEALVAVSPAYTHAPGITTRMEVLNLHLRQGMQHRFSYDAETLIGAVARAGFVNVIRSEFGRSRDAQLAIDSPARASASLYVEATKPHAP